MQSTVLCAGIGIVCFDSPDGVVYNGAGTLSSDKKSDLRGMCYDLFWLKWYNL